MPPSTASRRTRKTSPTAAARLKARVVAIVAAIPEGRVTTYGLIARKLRATPRQVARVLAHFTPEESATLPWFRVVSAKGVIGTVKLGATGRRQIALLRDEGVLVTGRNRVAGFAAVVWAPG
jgi:methylated-DNA-protein-cysteine methyltransferase-like protein